MGIIISVLGVVIGLLFGSAILMSIQKCDEEAWNEHLDTYYENRKNHI